MTEEPKHKVPVWIEALAPELVVIGLAVVLGLALTLGFLVGRLTGLCG